MSEIETELKMPMVNFGVFHIDAQCHKCKRMAKVHHPEDICKGCGSSLWQAAPGDQALVEGLYKYTAMFSTITPKQV